MEEILSPFSLKLVSVRKLNSCILGEMFWPELDFRDSTEAAVCTGTRGAQLTNQRTAGGHVTRLWTNERPACLTDRSGHTRGHLPRHAPGHHHHWSCEDAVAVAVDAKYRIMCLDI